VSLLSILCTVLLTAFAVAEPPITIQAAPPTPVPPSVFDLQSRFPPPTSSKSLDGVERNIGEEPDYNTAQRKQWMDKCGPKREVSMQDFRDCYEAEKRKTQAEVRKSFDARERRQSQPFRNVGPEADPGETRNPAFDADVQSIKE
jgi:hypothetical protein